MCSAIHELCVLVAVRDKKMLIIHYSCNECSHVVHLFVKSLQKQEYQPHSITIFSHTTEGVYLVSHE